MSVSSDLALDDIGPFVGSSIVRPEANIGIDEDFLWPNS